MVTTGEGERWASGRERCSGRASRECCRLFFILKNSERMKVKENKYIGPVVHRPRKCGVQTVECPHRSIFDGTWWRPAQAATTGVATKR